MTHLFNDPTTFMEDALAGFLDANSQYVAGVPGGVVRATETPPGKVAVIVGGGSGHYPAFCGVVGPGFADGAVVGNIFTSPSTDDAYNVGKAADNGGGVLFSTGNYAGDVMNFNLAQERLTAEGIDTRNIYVTDDVASAPVEELHKRRGIAGDFVVFKVAGAAADAGYSLDEVERVGRLANDRTRTMGIGLNGCTMPGADDQLFHVPKGKMGVGLGIHGEPGIAEEPLPSAAEVGEMLLDRVLAEEPADSSQRVGAILNGLGATKYEELFVVWKTVAGLLRERGYTVVDPEVGELVTSLDMAGISLTLVYLDEELERFWTAPADTPAYRKGSAVAATGERRDTSAAFAAAAEVTEGSEASRRAAAIAVDALAAMEVAIRDAEQELARIDAIAGDGDHGRGMVKGVTFALEAARPALKAGGGIATVLGAAGDAWAAKAGGTSGVLWGQALRALGASLGDDSDGVPADALAAAVRAGAETMQRLGKAELGDKTMLDALFPFVDALERGLAGGAPLATAWSEAAEVATTAAAETAELRPKIGRARPLAERSVGTPDPGATSLAMCTRVVGQLFAQREESS
jgi:dihydroxyacetone kinase